VAPILEFFADTTLHGVWVGTEKRWILFFAGRIFLSPNSEAHPCERLHNLLVYYYVVGTYTSSVYSFSDTEHTLGNLYGILLLLQCYAWNSSGVNTAVRSSDGRYT